MVPRYATQVLTNCLGAKVWAGHLHCVSRYQPRELGVHTSPDEPMYLSLGTWRIKIGLTVVEGSTSDRLLHQARAPRQNPKNIKKIRR